MKKVNLSEMINDSYMETYTERLIEECYSLPKEFNQNDWPFCHMFFDYGAAAEDLKADYGYVEYDGETYYIR